MNHTTTRAMRSGLIASLCLTLVACGGGGGGDGGGTPSNLSTLSWSTAQRLGTDTNQLPPAPTPQPVGGEPSTSLWLRLNNGQTTLMRSQASGNARGVASTTVQGGLPTLANGNATVAVVAGEHSMVVWTETSGNATSADGPGLYAQVFGPGTDTGPRLISGTFTGDARDTLPVIDASGNARIYWDEGGQPGFNKQLINRNWVTGSTSGLPLGSQLQRRLSGPDGQGWLFTTAVNGSGQVLHQVGRVTAANGLGGFTNVEAPNARLSQLRLASPDINNGYTTATLLYPAGGGDGSFVIRRAINGVVQGTSSTVNAPGAAQPNLRYTALATSAGGQALLVWSTGTGNVDSALYAARRSATGVWSTASLLVTLPAPSDGNSLLDGLNANLGPNGQAMVAYRARSATGALPRIHALVANDDAAWSADTTLTYSGYTIQEPTLATTAFNAAGTPGVLQVINTTAQGNFFPVTVLMSTWANNRWTSTPLATDVELPYINSVMLGQIRLAPQGSNGWLALWDQGNGPGDSLGYRELWASEFR